MKKNITSKDLITLALYELILRKKDYESISVMDICEKAGISRMTFYRHYNNKNDVFIDYSDERFAEFFDEIKKEKNIDLEKLIYSLFVFCQKYKRQIYILSKSKQEQLILSQFENYIRYLIATNKQYKETLKDNPLLPPFAAGALFYVLVFWLNRKEEITPERMTSYVHDIVNALPKL